MYLVVLRNILLNLDNSEVGVVIDVTDNLDIIHRLRPKQQNFSEDGFVSVFVLKVKTEKMFCWAHWKYPQRQVYYTFNHYSILKLIKVVAKTRRESPPKTMCISKHRCPLGPRVFLGTLFSNTRIQCSFCRMQTQVSHPYKTAINTVSYTFNFCMSGHKTGRQNILDCMIASERHTYRASCSVTNITANCCAQHRVHQLTHCGIHSVVHNSWLIKW
jgi:hypothetical protein